MPTILCLSQISTDAQIARIRGPNNASRCRAGLLVRRSSSNPILPSYGGPGDVTRRGRHVNMPRPDVVVDRTPAASHSGAIFGNSATSTCPVTVEAKRSCFLPTQPVVVYPCGKTGRDYHCVEDALGPAANGG